jgi:hypothetical protein
VIQVDVAPDKITDQVDCCVPLDDSMIFGSVKLFISEGIHATPEFFQNAL